jgi:hypothetical protein
MNINKEISAASLPTEETQEPLVSFLYKLLRDYVTSGVVTEIVADSITGETVTFTDGNLARQAKVLAKLLTQPDRGV